MIDDVSERAVACAKHKIVRAQYLENRMARGVRTTQIEDPPKGAEVTINGIKPQPPRITPTMGRTLTAR